MAWRIDILWHVHVWFPSKLKHCTLCQWLISEFRWHNVYFLWPFISFEAHLVRQNDIIYLLISNYISLIKIFLFSKSNRHNPFQWNLSYTVLRKWVMFRVRRPICGEEWRIKLCASQHSCSPSYISSYFFHKNLRWLNEFQENIF